MLRDYQVEAIEKTKQSIRDGNKKIILSLATGAGKSIIARNIVEMAGAKGSEVLYTAHRTILIEQMQETFKGLTNVVAETLQTSKNRDYDKIDIIIADEMHFGVNSPMQNKVLKKYPNAIVIGLSATPILHNGNRIDGWDDIIDIVQLKDLIERGYASRVKVLSTANIDTDIFGSSGGDFNSKDVYNEVSKSSIASNVISIFKKYAKNMKTIFYCVNQKHAEQLNEMLVSDGFKSSVYHSKLHKKTRAKIFQEFRDNELQILCSVESLTTGVDLPDIYCLVLATPTKSIIKAVQIYGRATRLNPSDPNKQALILDCGSVVENTVHPLQKLDFDAISDKKNRECGCGGNMLLVSTKMSAINLDTGEYTETKKFFCTSCKNEEIKETIKVYEFNFCIECEKVIEAGTSRNYIEDTKEAMTMISVCPHCGNEKVIREVLKTEVKVEEIIYSELESWDGIERELRKAKNKDGKKYHHYWSKRVANSLREEGFSIVEVRNFIKRYNDNGWALGGIFNAMMKKKNNR